MENEERREMVERAFDPFFGEAEWQQGLDLDALAEQIAIEVEIEHTQVPGAAGATMVDWTFIWNRKTGNVMWEARGHVGKPGEALALILSLEKK